MHVFIQSQVTLEEVDGLQNGLVQEITSNTESDNAFYRGFDSFLTNSILVHVT